MVMVSLFYYAAAVQQELLCPIAPLVLQLGRDNLLRHRRSCCEVIEERVVYCLLEF